MGVTYSYLHSSVQKPEVYTTRNVTLYETNISIRSYIKEWEQLLPSGAPTLHQSTAFNVYL
jgi:hypothetical protein